VTRAHNFCAGPAALPAEVLQRVQSELLDWRGAGASIMELSHRSQEFVGVAERAEQTLRALLSISDEYAVLFQQGGASQQFAAVPLNLSRGDDTVDQVVTGQWSKKALAEGKRHVNVNVASTSEGSNFSTIQPETEWELTEGAAYLHYCPNETIGGLEFDFVPKSNPPVVADMSSTILSRPIDVSRFGVIYAGAQKNIGPAGLCLVIVKRSLLERSRPDTPAMLSWKVAADNDSMYNTPPTFAIYLSGLVFEWIESKGGLAAIQAINEQKAATLYDAIDSSDFYDNPVDVQYRSLMNVPFTLADASLDALFLEKAEAEQLLNLKGHRSVGGMRASIYNAVEQSSVDALCDFMHRFEKEHG
jgi:phosphoserine aminotransferase